MDIGVVVALIVAISLTLIAGVLAGLFGGMWWQARKTAEVWEKAYTHVRELLPAIKYDSYNTGRPTPSGGVVPAGKYGVVGETPPEQGITKERVRVAAETAPSEAARTFAADFLEDDPLGPQIRR